MRGEQSVGLDPVLIAAIVFVAAAIFSSIFYARAQESEANPYVVESVGTSPDGTEIIYVAEPLPTSTIADSLTAQNKVLTAVIADVMKADTKTNTNYIYGRLDYIVRQLNTIQNLCATRR